MKVRLMDKGRGGHKSAADLEAPATGNRVYYDLEQTGFGLRVTSSGARSFILNYWVKGRERRLTIGAHPEWSVLAARTEAKRLRVEVDRGNDPLAERKAEHAAPTMADLCERYIEQHLPRKRTRSAGDDAGMIARYVLPSLGSLKVAEVEHVHIDRLHRTITRDGKATRANRVVALCSKLFSLADKWGMRNNDNPCRHVERNPEAPRATYLSQDQIETLGRVLDAHPDRDAAEVIGLLILTGARRGEVLAMAWDQIDLASGVWRKPASSTKQKREHVCPLSPQALAVLRKRSDDNIEGSPYVFPGTGGTGHLVEVKRSWSAIRAKAGLGDCRMHDLRHSFAAVLASSGVGLLVIGRMLGHSNPTTTNRYAHLTDNAARDAANVAGRLIGRR